MSVPRILVVDDEPSILSLCKRTLEAPGWHVLVASNSECAKAIIQEQKVDLVIADVRMPMESGISLLYEIKSNIPDLALILITGYPDLSAIDAAVRLHVNDFIIKPFSPQELVTRVENVLIERSKALRQGSSPVSNDLCQELVERLQNQSVHIVKGTIQEQVAGKSLLIDLDNTTESSVYVVICEP
jgi:DNA-binding NtrC family response regulator